MSASFAATERGDMEALIAVEETTSGRTEVTDLPSWPLLAALYGLPLYWALGMLPFIYMMLAGLMGLLLLTRGRITYLAGSGPYFGFLLWVGVAVVGVDGGGQLVGYAWRAGDLLAVGVFLLYYANSAVRPRDVVRALTYVWVVVVALGLLAVTFPDVRLTTPTQLLLPGAIAGHPLVNELVSPRLAEVQNPWGVSEPYVRPAAPFPYTNSWGAAYVLLTPVAMSAVLITKSWAVRLALACVLVASVVPAVATSNRGMFLGLGAALAYVGLRLALQGRLLPLFTLAVGAGAVGGWLTWSGAVAEILGRQEFSNSTGTRASVYAATFEATLSSPLVGWGAPQEVPGVEVALGTQGYIWTLMYSYGFVGLGLFIGFLLGAVLRTLRVTTTPEILLHAVPVSACMLIVYYGLGSTQLLIVTLVCALLLDGRRTVDAHG